MTTIAECSSVDEADGPALAPCRQRNLRIRADELTVPFRGSIGPVRLQSRMRTPSAARLGAFGGGPA